MEDIYEDLDNYNDVNCIRELRTENMELKVKLKEHAAAMEKLQKEYDTLEREFKKLENNYSSLLKTARSEIERKTERITQLNKEKDMMVLNALQNGRPIRRHFNKPIHNSNNEKPVQEKSNQKEEDVKFRNERGKPTLIQVKNREMVSCPDTDDRSNLPRNIDKTMTKANTSSIRKSEFKEEVKTENNNTSKIQASSIKDRRKSMPAVSLPIEEFSSDGECEQSHPTRNTRVDIPPSHKFERKNINRFPMERHITLASETSSLDDRGSNYHESSKESYRGRTNRRYDNSSIRGGDKHEVAMRYRKQYSPDRGHRKQQQWEYNDDYRRQEHGRYRSLESPPPETFNRHQRRNPEPRTTYDNDRYTYNRDKYTYDHDKYRPRYEENYALKHKISNDIDEPHSKRQKTESFGNPDKHYNDYKRCKSNTHSTPEISPHEYDTMRMSCQSPDYIHTDAEFSGPKEIMDTAATHLEDPRITSKRYVVNKENGKETLSIAVSRNIDIKSVDRAVWGVEDMVSVPYALTRRPSQCSEQNIYVGIESPEINQSIESGELFCDTEDDTFGNHKIPKKVNQIAILPQNINKQTIEHDSRQAEMQQSTNIENVLKTNYKSLKISQSSDNTPGKMNVPITDVGKHNLTEKHDNAKKPTFDEYKIPKKVNQIAIRPQITNKQTMEQDSRPAEVQQSTNIENVLKTNYKSPKISQSSDNTPGTRNVAIIDIGENNLTEKHDNAKKPTFDEYKIPKKVNQFAIRAQNINKQTMEPESRQAVVQQSTNIENVLKTNYISPIISQSSDNTQGKMNVPIIDVGENNLTEKNDNAKNPTPDQYSKKSLTIIQQNDLTNCISNDKNNSIHKDKRKSENETLSNIAIVADDLELSDENSDHGDSHKLVTEKAKKACKVQSNIKDVKQTDLTNNSKTNSRLGYHNTKTKKAIEVKLADVEVKAMDCDSAKKEKCKKKTSKSKEVPSKDLAANTDAIQMTEKKTRNKKEKESKPGEMKNKLSELFGDSSSLVTPEDLGLLSYSPICEDAQDAMDMKINQIIDAQPSLVNDAETPGNKVTIMSEIKKSEEPTYDNNIKIIKNSKTDDKVPKDNKKKKSVKRQEKPDSNKISPNTVYINVSPKDDLKEPDVVKTVIISTGVQPPLLLENNCEPLMPLLELQNNCKPLIEHPNNAERVPQQNPVESVVGVKKQDIIKALATSTPQKEISALKSSEIERKTTDFINNSNNLTDSINTTAQVGDQSDKNTLEGNDAPDVRIFVKRRRKLVKRPPMT